MLIGQKNDGKKLDLNLNSNRFLILSNPSIENFDLIRLNMELDLSKNSTELVCVKVKKEQFDNVFLALNVVNLISGLISKRKVGQKIFISIDANLEDVDQSDLFQDLFADFLKNRGIIILAKSINTHFVSKKVQDMSSFIFFEAINNVAAEEIAFFYSLNIDYITLSDNRFILKNVNGVWDFNCLTHDSLLKKGDEFLISSYPPFFVQNKKDKNNGE